MNILLLIVVGFIIGTIVITLGGGGAAFYLGILTTVFGLGPASAAATSLVTSFPSLLIGSYSYFRQHKIKVEVAWQMIIFAVPAVIVDLFCHHIFQLKSILILLGRYLQFWVFRPYSASRMTIKSRISGLFHFMAY